MQRVKMVDNIHDMSRWWSGRCRGTKDVPRMSASDIIGLSLRHFPLLDPVPTNVCTQNCTLHTRKCLSNEGSMHVVAGRGLRVDIPVAKAFLGQVEHETIGGPC